MPSCSFSVILELRTIVFSEHNLYNNRFFFVKTGILKQIRFTIDKITSMSILHRLLIIEDFFEITL